MIRRKFGGSALLIASHNPGKVREIRALLSPLGIDVQSAADVDLPEPEETGDTFIANSELKALAAATTAGQVSIADDSGLVVPALGGDPGIRSARWAGPQKDFGHAMQLVHDALEKLGQNDQAATPAYFVCALTLAWPDGHTETVEGHVHGVLTWPPRGDLGFGYDPLFIPKDYARTFGEMDPDEKHAISHRADAFRNLIDACLGP